VRVVIGGMTMRLGRSTEPMRAGVRRMFMALLSSSSAEADDPVTAEPAEYQFRGA
jgi:hypothetical protein